MSLSLDVPALVAALPQTLTEQRDEVRALLQRSRRDLMAVSRAVYGLQERWQQEGRPGGSFDRYLGGETGEHEEHATIQSRLRSGEAQARGIQVPNDTQALHAGVMLRRLTEEGVPLREAVPQVQAAAAAGLLKRGKNRSAPEGCTHVYYPVTAVPALELARRHLRQAAGEHDAPDADVAPPGPDEIGQLFQVVASLPVSVLAAFRDGDAEAYAWVARDELQRIYELLGEEREELGMSVTDTAEEEES